MIRYKYTYRIKKNHSFVHDLEMVSHNDEVVVEFVKEMVDFIILNLNNE